MAESILYGAVSNILSKLLLNAGQDLGLIFGWKKELEKLQGTLSTINAVLLDAEEKQESNHALKSWIRRLEDVVYDADDLLDEFDYAILRQKVLARRQVRKFFSSSNPIAFGLKMGPRLKEIRERLDSIAADISKFNLSPRVTTDMKTKYVHRKTASKVRSEMIGREKDKEHIIKSLFQKHHHGDSISNIVAIVGFGGLGKTALAQLVYNDVEIENFFNPRIWVCVSEEFDVCIIFKKILESLGDGKVDDLDLDIYLKRLEEKLRGKRYLLVLDDVWNENNLKWNNFSNHLVFGAPESKILVTTRSTTVAATIGVRSPYHLKGLTEEQSQDLLEKVAFEGREIDPKLGLIGKLVAQKCKGVPLSIKCLGGLMRQKPNENYWLSIQENEIWKLFKEDDGIFPVLRLSYTYLPRHLKQCFAFCSLFPKDFLILKKELIYQWGAQGYIELGGENENIQDIGDDYFNDLLSRSFFQEEKEYGENFCFKMHDLIHDLALLVADSQVAGSQFCWMKNNEEKKLDRVRHVSLKDKSKEAALILSKTKGIRTVITREYIVKDLFIRNVTVSSLKCLRMLELMDMDLDILSNSFGELKHLRYLTLSGDWKVLPDAITKLYNLQTLELNCRFLEKLPRDIQRLINLKFLIHNCYGLKCLPKGLGKLTSLQKLSSFVVNRVEESFSTAATLNGLRDLNDLGNSLTIRHLEKVRNVELESQEANLKKKERLRSLKLYWNRSCRSPGNPPRVDNEMDESLLKNLEPHPNLKKLTVEHYEGARFSSWLSSLTNLVKLHIGQFYNCQQLPPLDHLSSLKSLSLKNFHVLKHLPPLDHLSSLESLSLGNLLALDHLSPLDHLSSLKYLELVNLNALEYVADSFPLPCSTSRKPFFPSLKRLQIRCPNLKGWWRTKNENQGSTAEQPYFPCLSELEIEGSPNLTSMPLFPSLDQELNLRGTSIRPLQQTLKMKMTEASMTSEEASSSSGSTFHSYSSTTLPLSNLKSLHLYGIKDLYVLPFLENLTSLAKLSLRMCPKLELLLPQNMSCIAPLKDLSIRDCPNLRSLPDWILNLSSLKTLNIQGCLELQHMPEGMPQLTSLEGLFVGNCHNLRALPGWILNLTSLRSLRIRECLELQYMPEGMHQLTSLKVLSVGNCRNLRALPGWILNLTSLQTLQISQCRELQCMPEGTHRLITSLEELSISECPHLSEKCEKEIGELWPRIAQIPSIIIDGRRIQ